MIAPIELHPGAKRYYDESKVPRPLDRGSPSRARCSPPGCGGREVVVRDDGGRVLVEAALPEYGRFALEYRHSYYRVPARERVPRPAAPASAWSAVESPSEAVLDYYAIAGAKTARALDGARARAARAASSACR